MITLEDLPHRRVEAWKWSDVRAAARAVDTLDLAGAWDAFRLTSGEGDARIADFDGASEIAALARRVQPDDVVQFVVAAGQTRALPLDFEAAAGAGAHRIQVLVEPGAKLLLTERWAAESGAFGMVSLDVHVGAAAEVERLVVAADTGDAVVLSDMQVHVAERARYAQTALTFGAKLARLETHVTVAGPGADVTLNGASLLAGEAHADHTTIVTHAAPGATTRETFRSVVTDRATGVFQGKIKVERPAQHTDAEMDHKALLLTEGATVNAKPELEIYADDVACAHGNTAGALDAAALHYMRARGLPETRAKALLIEAFVGEVIDGVAHEPTRDALRGEARAWMETHL